MKYFVPFALFLLIGCEDTKEHEVHCGKVVDKDIEEHRDKTDYICRDGEVIELRTITSPTYIICVSDGTLSIWVEVNKGTHESLEVGDIVTKTKMGWKKVKTVIKKTRKLKHWY